MPKVFRFIPETELSVTRPVVLEVSRRLFAALGIHPSTQIFYPGEGIDKVAQAGSQLGRTERNEPNLMPFSDRIKIEVDEEYEADRFGSTAIARAEHFPVFRDDALNTLIKPIYSSTEYTLNFKYKASDKTIANRWRDELRLRYSNGREVFSHSVSFNWELPGAFMRLLEMIHGLREAVLPYGDTFDEYFRKHVDQRASEVVNLAGQQAMWTISETQGDILGYFDFVGSTEKGSMESDGEAWTTAFSYKFRFNKPVACNMVYPIIVHNQMVPQTHRPSPEDDPALIAARNYSLSSVANYHLRGGKTPMSVLSGNGYSIPEHDEFIPGSVVSQTLRVFTALLRFDLNDRSDLLNLGQLGKIRFTKTILDFMKKEASFMSRPYQSVFVLSLYDETELVAQDPITVDADLNVRSKVDLDPRRQYHLRLSLVKDWRLLPAAAIIRLRENAPATIELIKVIDPRFEENGKLPPFVGGYLIPPKNMQETIDIINRDLLAAGNGQLMGPFTVGTLFVEARKDT